MSVEILIGDCRETLKTLPDESAQCCVTSPPYFGLRDYGHAGQIGLEHTPAEYVAQMVAVFREVRRALADDGMLWLNLGDSYAREGGERGRGNHLLHMQGKQKRMCAIPDGSGLKPKDLIGIPWRVAFALQADSWYLRSDIIWHKPNPMPESVTDRPTKSHEYLFLLTKSERYYYDADAIKEPAITQETRARILSRGQQGYAVVSGVNGSPQQDQSGEFPWDFEGGRNKRTVWTVATQPYAEAHFATYPPDLIKPCILAGSKPGDTILDPFGGSGTTGMVALELGRKAILCELNPEYAELTRQRCNVTPGLPL
jgi:DNA modification methylase